MRGPAHLTAAADVLPPHRYKKLLSCTPEFIIVVVIIIIIIIIIMALQPFGRLCGLMVRVSGYRSKGPGFDSRPYHIC
jgi:hypothetical protein